MSRRVDGLTTYAFGFGGRGWVYEMRIQGVAERMGMKIKVCSGFYLLVEMHLTYHSIMKTHKDLKVWQMGIELTQLTYLSCEQLPKSEIYGLAAQLKRAAVSIPTNIAEGAARNHRKEYIQFCYIALGSLAELDTLYILGLKIGALQENITLENQILELRKKLLNFIKYLKQTC